MVSKAVFSWEVIMADMEKVKEIVETIGLKAGTNFRNRQFKDEKSKLSYIACFVKMIWLLFFNNALLPEIGYL